MRIFNGFLILFTAVFLWLLPITTAIYDFRTDVRTDSFAHETLLGETTANVTLTKPVYDSDTNTIDILSSISTDSPAYASYNGTSRLLGIDGLVASENRTLTVSYDIDALEASDAINTLMDNLPYIWLICIAVFAPAALVALFTARG